MPCFQLPLLHQTEISFYHCNVLLLKGLMNQYILDKLLHSILFLLEVQYYLLHDKVQFTRDYTG